MWNIVLILISTLFTGVLGYPHFSYEIPNGRRVVHPCYRGYSWFGVGHTSADGGGLRNPFGEDFAANRFEWNTCICRKDSDGDGLTNGEELGDPDCKWKLGDPIEDVPGKITHPGVCEPVNDTKCLNKNDFLNCTFSSQDLQCDGITKPGTQNMTLNLGTKNVTTDVSTYMCQAFNLSLNGDFHMIASTPYIESNCVVANEMILYGCSPTTESDAWGLYSQPTPCHMIPCKDKIMYWSLGSSGTCLDANFGFKLGNSGYRTMVMQVHWNNPQMKTTLTDSSGLTIYYTDQLRQNDGGVLNVGPALVQIKPDPEGYGIYGGCSEECTNRMLGNSVVYITSIVPLMSTRGFRFQVQHIRNNSVSNLLDSYPYAYGNEGPQQLTTPQDVKAGDEIKVTCHVDSAGTSTFTYEDDTQDPDCLAVLSYYSYLPGAINCYATDGFGICSNDLLLDAVSYCNVSDFHAVVASNNDSIQATCDEKGKMCKSGCETALEPVVNHQCLNKLPANAIKAIYASNEEGRKFLKRLSSCEADDHDSEHDHNGEEHTPVDCDEDEVGSASSTLSWSYLFVVAIALGCCA